MSTEGTQQNPLFAELNELDAEVLPLLERRDGAAVLLLDLPRRIPPADVAQAGNRQRVWELVGIFYMGDGRFHEALAIFWALYQQMLVAQCTGSRVHKGMPLVWMSDCYKQLGFRVHAKRYLMLTLCEDAIVGRRSHLSGIWRRVLSSRLGSRAQRQRAAPIRQ